MRIISWNCNGALRKKFEQLGKLKGDIYVIQECEDPQQCSDERYKSWAANYIWVGDNKNKGLGVFCKTQMQVSLNEWESNDAKYFISIKINDSFDLVAVWNQRNSSRTYRYIGQFWKYLQVNKDKMTNCLVLGDFNSNKIWDKKPRICNHSDVVRELDEIGIRSLYHEFFNEEQGKETKPTFFLQKNLDKKYHIDYVFADKNYFKAIEIDIGVQSDWLQISDHMPITIDF
jgi:exonuclease III